RGNLKRFNEEFGVECFDQRVTNDYTKYQNDDTGATTTGLTDASSNVTLRSPAAYNPADLMMPRSGYKLPNLIDPLTLSTVLALAPETLPTAKLQLNTLLSPRNYSLPLSPYCFTKKTSLYVFEIFKFSSYRSFTNRTSRALGSALVWTIDAASQWESILSLTTGVREEDTLSYDIQVLRIQQ
ncbi:hypothetical protein PPACK8108_LOCUS3513, partial [Phakopsora pachyrhizi]